MNADQPQPRVSQVDEQAALRALDGDKDLLQDLAQMFCEDAPVVLEKLMLALEANDAPAARRAVHNVKGLAATFYAQPTIELAQRLEANAAEGQLDMLKHGGIQKLECAVREIADELRSRCLTQ
jgi:HPt (histidine-containing phosphotransfer) domain-containing protein